MPLVIEEVFTLGDGSATTVAKNQLAPHSRTPEQLVDIVSRFAASEGWLDRVRLRTEHRWYERLHLGADYDIWVISWMPGQATGFHDHGESAGAFVVTTGVLEEHLPGKRSHAIYPGQPRGFGFEYTHDVRNSSLAPAVSIHAYSPPLSEMNEYELDGTDLVRRDHESEQTSRRDHEGSAQNFKSANWSGSSSIDQMLASARARLRRLTPEAAYEALAKRNAVLVDIRPEAQRTAEGIIPGAFVVERNVLEWRFDPTSEARLAIAVDHDLEVILFCSEGYTSSLAAAALQDLGLWRATDVVGGFHAWCAAGLANAPFG
ncbi:Rhodanese-related sulfurtransferase [Granulicella pectinivorans]|uniref:Rhodanese-related sulfurtransferase n=1 Tax=Granulicella pectinivorans TaxID=474950 RepID=A0A1I6MEA4_9BACT|nr:rhodanese-like domain-containing protein [Granulicella pectinivorans]SFS13917.1 Rhodanese-related sulfurtransferase [Granulicella pectinivorans]